MTEPFKVIPFLSRRTLFAQTGMADGSTCMHGAMTELTATEVNDICEALHMKAASDVRQARSSKDFPTVADALRSQAERQRKLARRLESRPVFVNEEGEMK